MKQFCSNCGKEFDSPVGCPWCGAAVKEKIVVNTVASEYERLLDKETAAENELATVSYMGPLVLLVIGFFTLIIIIGGFLIFASIVWFLMVAMNKGEAERKLLAAQQDLRRFESIQRMKA